MVIEDDARHEPRGEGATLSVREREIVARARKGATDKEIADDLEMSIAALRSCWIRIRDKVGAVNRTNAIALVAVDLPAGAAPDCRQRLVDALSRDRIATWVWQPRIRQALLDATGLRLFCLPNAEDALSLDRLLAHIWAPDRARFERFLHQGAELRPMTPIELRVGVPGEYRHLIRTINMAVGPSSDGTLLLASTTLHIFAS